MSSATDFRTRTLYSTDKRFRCLPSYPNPQLEKLYQTIHFSGGLKHGQPINIPATASFTELVAGSHSTLESGKKPHVFAGGATIENRVDSEVGAVTISLSVAKKRITQKTYRLSGKEWG